MDSDTAGDPTGNGAAEGPRAAAMRDLEHQISMLFRQTRSLSTRMAAEIHPDLELPSYGLLLAILDLDPAGDGVRAADLSERTKLHKSTLSRTIGDLERLELVTRVPDPQDARARLVTLTDYGRDVIKRSRAGRTALMLRRLEHWNAEDLRTLADLLGRFSLSLSDDN